MTGKADFTGQEWELDPRGAPDWQRARVGTRRRWTSNRRAPPMRSAIGGVIGARAGRRTCGRLAATASALWEIRSSCRADAPSSAERACRSTGGLRLGVLAVSLDRACRTRAVLDPSSSRGRSPAAWSTKAAPRGEVDRRSTGSLRSSSVAWCVARPSKRRPRAGIGHGRQHRPRRRRAGRST